MITNTQPLMSYLDGIRESGVDVAVFPTSNGDRYALRLVDPDEPGTGLAYLAAFSSKVKEANRPADNAGRLNASRSLNAMLKDATAAAKYVVCFCVIDDESLAKFPQYTEADKGKTFIMVGIQSTATSDEVLYAGADEPETATSDSAPKGRRGRVR